MSNAVFVVDDSWIARAKPATVLAIRTKVLATEELLVSKLFVSRRERFDGADIAHIVYGSGTPLNWNRILKLVGDHWELLLWSLLYFDISIRPIAGKYRDRSGSTCSSFSKTTFTKTIRKSHSAVLWSMTTCLRSIPSSGGYQTCCPSIGGGD